MEILSNPTTKKSYTRFCVSAIKTSAILFFSFVLLQDLSAQQIYGVTIDDITNISTQKTALSSHCKKMTTRVVFDGTQSASYYLSPLQTIQPVSYIMGELLDSYELPNFTTPQYTTRAQQYLAALGSLVDIWEIGNEVNGNWTGTYATVGADITAAYNVFHGAGKKTSLTLYYNPNNCDGSTELTPLQFSNQYVDATVRAGVDYVLLSYYETQCNNYRPPTSVLLTLFDQLHALYPNAQLGFGEVGLPNAVTAGTLANATSIMKYYYSLSIPRSYYVGGYFWWYWTEDCVPKTKALWKTLDSIICIPVSTSIEETNVGQESMSVYPNPSNGKFELEINNLQLTKNYILEIYNLQGKKIVQSTITNAKSEIDLSNQSKGIYLIKFNDGQAVLTKKVIIE